jgi:hypothetical protein
MSGTSPRHLDGSAPPAVNYLYHRQGNAECGMRNAVFFALVTCG